MCSIGWLDISESGASEPLITDEPAYSSLEAKTPLAPSGCSIDVNLSEAKTPI